MSQDKMPEVRARAAVEQLSAEGKNVTARAVRDLSGVRMAVAADAAREYAAAASAAVEVPAMPDVVVARVDALWREAVIAARGELEIERDGWLVKLEQASGEVEAATSEIQRLDELVEELRGLVAERDREEREVAAVAAAQLAEQRSRADRAEAVVDAVREERDRLLAERDSMREQVDALRRAQESGE